MDSSNENMNQQVRAMQIITLALAMGIVVFAVVLLTVIRPEPREDEPMFVYLGVGFGLIATVAGFLVPRLVASQLPTSLQTYQTTLIVGAAVFEGGAFFNLMAYMLEGQIVSVAIAGVLMLFILLLFPTVGRVQEWLTNRERREKEHEAFNR